MTETFFEKCKMNLAIAFFIFVYYPIKYVIYPFIKIIYENIYILAAVFVMWVNFTITGSPAEANRLLSEKVRANPSGFVWIVQPIITVWGFDLTPIVIVTIILFLLLIYRAYDVISQVWDILKTWAGHILMISLWGWYTLIGNKEKSLMFLRNPDEQRSLIIFYGLVILVIIIVFGLVLLQNMVSNSMMAAFNFTPTMANETITTTANQTIIPLNISTSTVEGLV
jgi:hypothetical protein